MKQWSAALLAMALSTTAMAGHGPFTGFYLGANAGVIQSEINDNFGVILDLNANSNQQVFFTTGDSKLTDVSLGAGLLLGYAVRIERMFMAGVEVRANFSDLNSTTQIDANSIPVPGGVGLEFLGSTSVELEKDFAALAKLGLIFDSNVLFYGLIGADWGKFEIDSQSSVSLANARNSTNIFSDISDNTSRYKCGLLLGLGLEYAMTRCTSIGIEYNYVDYKTLKFPDTISDFVYNNGVAVAGSELGNTNSIKAKTNKTSLFFNFYFA